MGIDKIEIEYESDSWDDVSGETIVLLKGSQYNFKASRLPADVNWPIDPNWTSYANWSGIVDVNTADEILEDVTFATEGTYSPAAQCGPNRKERRWAGQNIFRFLPFFTLAKSRGRVIL